MPADALGPEQVSEKCPAVFRKKPATNQAAKQVKRWRSRASLLGWSRRGRWRARLIIAGCCAGFWLAGEGSRAQGRSPPALVVSAQIWLSPGSERALDVKVVPGDAIPPSAMIVIRGVPQGIRFSEGRPFGPGVWVIPVGRLANLTVQTPADAGGGGTLELALTSLEGTPIAEARTSVILMPATKNPAGPAPTVGRSEAPAAITGGLARELSPPPQALPTPPQTPPTPPPALPRPAEPPNKAALVILLEKGRESARLGNIQHARQFYLRAAEKGLAEAALALAMTYDPDELARLKGVNDVRPDPDLARKWYEKAGELGSQEAAARLTQLGQR